MNTVTRAPKWQFYPLWIGLSLLAIPLAFFFDILVLRLITRIIGDYIYINGVRHITEDYLAIYPWVLFTGLLTGLFQYNLLRRYLPHMSGWILATLGGWLLGVALNLVAAEFYGPDQVLSLDIAFLLMGLSIGVVQWLLLRRRVAKAGWWVVATILGWGLLALTTTGNSVGQFGLFMLGIFPACATAVASGWLIRHLHLATQTETAVC